MTTATKLWLGFGTLTALLVLSSVAIILRVRAIEGKVGEIQNAHNLIAETRELEINFLDYALGVRTGKVAAYSSGNRRRTRPPTWSGI